MKPETDSPALSHDPSADAATRARSAVPATRAERSWSVVTRPTARGHQLPHCGCCLWVGP